MPGLVDEGGMSYRVDRILVPPGVKAGDIHVTDLLVWFGFEMQRGGIRASSKKRVSRVEGGAEV